MRATAVLVAALLLAACAQEKILMGKPGMTLAEYNRDHYACYRDAVADGDTLVYDGLLQRRPNNTLYIACMNARGYTRAAK